jgi:excisionase family DNA binding protein
MFHHERVPDGRKRVRKGEDSMKPESEQEFISLNELQEILGIGRTKAYDLVTSGDLPAVRIGRVIRVSKQDLTDWLERQKYQNVSS